MAVALVQGISNLSTTATATATATLPAAATAGNILVAFAHTASKTTTPTATGYTMPTGGNANVNGRSANILYKVAAGGETAISMAIVSGTWEAHFLEYSGVDTTTPVMAAITATGSTATVTTTGGVPIQIIASNGATTGPSSTAWSSPTIGGSAATFITGAPSTRLQSGTAAYGATYELAVASSATSYINSVTGVGSNITTGIIVLNPSAAAPVALPILVVARYL